MQRNTQRRHTQVYTYTQRNTHTQTLSGGRALCAAPCAVSSRAIETGVREAQGSPVAGRDGRVVQYDRAETGRGPGAHRAAYARGPSGGWRSPPGVPGSPWGPGPVGLQLAFLAPPDTGSAPADGRILGCENSPWRKCSPAFHLREMQSNPRSRFNLSPGRNRGFPVALVLKITPANAGDVGTQAASLGREDALEEEMAAHSSIPASTIPWAEKPGGLQSMGS